MDGGRWNEHEEVHLQREGQMGGGGGTDGKRVREEEREAKCSERCVYVCAL